MRDVGFFWGAEFRLLSPHQHPLSSIFTRFSSFRVLALRVFPSYFALPMRIPEDIIDEVRRSTDIVDVVGGVVKLRKRGKNFLGLCPFHQEKTPSFNVNPEMQIYKCFGCGKGGNVFQFLMETERLSFVEVVKQLADKAGIRIPEGKRDEQQYSELDRLYSILSFAGKSFHSNLVRTDEGKSALTYFKGRHFSEETVRIFGLGYSMNAWDHLLKRSRDDGYKPEELEKAGLLRKRDDGSYYDYFRGRAMFPILLANRKVAGFGARKIRDDDPVQGKYINSPDSVVYNKSTVLFGLSHSKTAIRQEDTALLVEGYVDMISLFQEGLQNVVASSGTALTDEQLRLLSRYSQNLVLLFDGDSAGAKAAIRGIDSALQLDFDVKVVEMPKGEDPDSLVRTKGAKAMKDLVAEARSFIDFKALLFARAGMMQTPEGKTKAVRSIVLSISRIQDEIKQAFYLKDVAERYGLYEGTLLRELEKLRGQSRPTPSYQGRPSAPDDVPAPVPETKPLTATDRDLLRVFVSGELQAIDHVLMNIREDDIGNPGLREVIRIALQELDRTGRVTVAALLDAMHDEALTAMVMDSAMNKYEISKAWGESEKEIEREDPLKIAHDVVTRLKMMGVQREIDENQREMVRIKQEGGDLSQHLRTHQELTSALVLLQKKERKQAESQE